MRGVVSIEAGRIAWTPHPSFAGVLAAWLMQRSSEAMPISCALVQFPSGAEVPEHAHPDEDDILFVLRGGASMRVEGHGEIPLKAGDFLRIPSGVRHRPHSFEDGFLAFNVWAPNPSLTPQTGLGEHHD